MLTNRLKKNYKQLKKWLNKNSIEAFRLYDLDIPNYPYIIDIYKNFAVVYERGNKDVDLELRTQHIQDANSAISSTLEIPSENIIWKERIKQRGSDQYKKLEASKNFITVNEGSLKFQVNLHDYLDSGLFSDHRPFRFFIQENDESSKTFLNLFSYTGAISVAAAKAGYIVTSVDMSNTYQEWAKRNFELNGIELSSHYFKCENALTFLKQSSMKYDTIFLDPPTFSNSKKMDNSFEVERDQENLINQTMNSLSLDGTLYFSNNKRGFKLIDSLKENYTISELSRWSIPKDFRDGKIHNLFKISHK